MVSFHENSSVTNSGIGYRKLSLAPEFASFCNIMHQKAPVMNCL